jgi:hypothetical protein
MPLLAQPAALKDQQSSRICASAACHPGQSSHPSISCRTVAARDSILPWPSIIDTGTTP